MNHLDRHRRFPWEIIVWKNWNQTLLYEQKAPNQPKPNPNPIYRTGRHVVTGQTSRSTCSGNRYTILTWLRGLPICLLNVYVNSTLHTSHFLVDTHLMTRTCVAQVQVWRAQRTFHIISCVIFMHSCCVFDSPRFSLPLLVVHFLSHHSVHQSSLLLLLPRYWWTTTLRTPADEDLDTVAEYDTLTSYWPNDYHISETAKPYIQESWTRMTLSTMTTPSAWRSLHHCSLRSEKNQRAVDKLVTLLKKVCCQVSRCLCVM